MRKKMVLAMMAAMGISAAALGLTAMAEEADNSVTVTEYGEYTEEDPYDLTFAFVEYYPQDDQARAEVEEAINEITIPQYHIRVTFLPLGYDLTSEENLMISGGDKLDVMTVVGNAAPGQIGMNGLVDLTDYLENTPEGEALRELLTDQGAKVCRIGDFIYGIPAAIALHENIHLPGLVLRSDICDELGFTEEYGLKLNDDIYQGVVYDWSVAEDMFRKVQEAYPDMIPLYFTSSIDPYVTWFDSLGDDFGVLDWSADHSSTTVVNKFETQTFKDSLEMLARWYDAGYIYADSVNMNDGWIDMFQAGNTFACPQLIKPGCLMDVANTPYDYYTMRFGEVEGAVSTTYLTFMNAGIATNSDDPDMAFKFITALYTNPRLMELWQYGIEGTHFQLLEDGSAYYVDGEDSNNYKYHQNTPWQLGNSLDIPVWNNEEGDVSYWEYRKNLDQWAIYSPAYGFNWDSSNYQTQLTALANAMAAYDAALKHGAVGGVENLDSFLDGVNQSLYAAGLQEVMDEKQRQLDAWIEANGGPAVTPQENLDKIAAVKGEQ